MTELSQKTPWDLDSFRDRGAWLAIAYLKASGGDLKLLMKLCKHPVLPKEIQNRVRLEMAVFSLAKATGIIEQLLTEHFARLPIEAVFKIKKVFMEGAWQFMGVRSLIPKDSDDIARVYADYINEDDKSGLLWSRLLKHGMSIAVQDMRRDLGVFEQTVLSGTTLTLALDSLQVSQDQIEQDHDSFLKAMES